MPLALELPPPSDDQFHFAFANDAAMGNLGYERAKADHYPTPPWVTEAVIPRLLEYRSKATAVWEPACGDGAMTNVLAGHFDRVVSTDLHDYGFGTPGIDFMEASLPEGVGMIVTNPPYGDDAEKFVRRALDLMRPVGGVVAMLMRHEYDCSKGRVDLFNQPPFAGKVVLTSRPRWIAGSTGSPRHNYSWYLWTFGQNIFPTLSYSVR